MAKNNSIASFLNDPESRRRVLDEALAESGGDLLDLLSEYSLDGNRLESVDSESGRIRTKRLVPQDIDYSRSSDEMILNGREIRKDGRRIFFGH
jgi:hypothetical protein